MGKRTVLLGVMAITTIATMWGGQADAAGPYRRWTTPKTFACASTLSGVQVQIGEQSVEFGGGLPGDAQYTTRVLSNGVETSVVGPSTVEQTTGSLIRPAINVDLATYPATVDLITNTLVSGNSVYTSTISITCAADGTGTTHAINQSTTPDPYRRWTAPKNFACTTLGDSTVQLEIADQDVQFNELTTSSQFVVTTTKNGTATTAGPFTVEQTSGALTGPSLTTGFAAYPITFSARIDTIVGGRTVHTSTLTVSCTQDASGSVAATNAIVPPPTTTTTAASTTTTTAAPTTTTTTTIAPTTSTTTIAPTTSTTVAPPAATTTAAPTTTTTLASGAATTTTIRRTTTTIRRTTTTVRRHPATGTATGPTMGIALVLLGLGAVLALTSRRRPA